MRRRRKGNLVIPRVRLISRTTIDDQIMVGINFLDLLFNILLSRSNLGRGRGSRGSFPNGGDHRRALTTPPASSPMTPLSPVRGSARGMPPVNMWSRGGPSFARTNGQPSTVAPNGMHQPPASTSSQGIGTGRGGQPSWAP